MKVKCNVCSNENNNFCIVKKVKVHINKKRKCKSYIYEPSKVKTKQEIPLTRVGFTKQQFNRQKAKENLKELKEIQKQEAIAKSLGAEGQVVMSTNYTDKLVNTKYPLTGDLSRFTTTATKGD